MDKQSLSIKGCVWLWLVAFLVAPTFGFSWVRNYHLGFFSYTNSVQQTSDGGYIIAGGRSAESTDYEDVFLLKTDADGDSQWVKTHGGGLNDAASCVRQTADGGYILTGYADGDPPPGSGESLLLFKTDSLGDTMWVRTWGGASAGYWVEQTKDGGYIVTGDCDGAYLWLIKTDENGDKEWELKFDDGGYEIGYCVKEVSEGGYIVAANIGLLRINETGDTLWLKPWAAGESVDQCKDGGYVIVDQWGGGEILIFKTDTDGDSLWAKLYGGAEEDDAYFVQQTTDGGYVVIGETESFGGGRVDVWLLKTDSLGDTLWTITYGGEYRENASGGQQTADGGYIIAGHKGALYPVVNDVLLIKTDSTGDVGVEEPPVTHPPATDWEVETSVGQTITLRWAARPEGFHAFVFDAAGRKVDEINVAGSSGKASWGEGKSTGVYFIVPRGALSSPHKVLLVK